MNKVCLSLMMSALCTTLSIFSMDVPPKLSYKESKKALTVMKSAELRSKNSNVKRNLNAAFGATLGANQNQEAANQQDNQPPTKKQKRFADFLLKESCKGFDYPFHRDEDRDGDNNGLTA